MPRSCPNFVVVFCEFQTLFFSMNCNIAVILCIVFTIYKINITIQSNFNLEENPSLHQGQISIILYLTPV